MIRNIIITGLGGQGILYISTILRKVLGKKFGKLSGYDNRGGAQRYGHVCSVIRFNDEGLDLPMGLEPPTGTCDFLISLEATEALKFNNKISSRTTLILDSFIMIPTNVRRVDEEYFKIKEIIAHFNKISGSLIIANLRDITEEKFGKQIYTNLFSLGIMLKKSTEFLKLEDFKDFVSEEELTVIKYGMDNVLDTKMEQK